MGRLSRSANPFRCQSLDRPVSKSPFPTYGLLNALCLRERVVRCRSARDSRPLPLPGARMPRVHRATHGFRRAPIHDAMAPAQLQRACPDQPRAQRRAPPCAPRTRARAPLRAPRAQQRAHPLARRARSDRAPSLPSFSPAPSLPADPALPGCGPARGGAAGAVGCVAAAAAGALRGRLRAGRAGRARHPAAGRVHAFAVGRRRAAETASYTARIACTRNHQRLCVCG